MALTNVGADRTKITLARTQVQTAKMLRLQTICLCVLQVLGRTLSMQFDGNWTAVEGIVVDKLGKYAYAIPGIGGGPATPFILDVALDVRAKVLPFTSFSARFEAPNFSYAGHPEI